MSRLGVTAVQSLPVIHYATVANAEMRQTPVYSYRLLASYGPGHDWTATEASMRSAASRFQVIAGAEDALMDASAYERELRPLGVEVTVLPGVDHIGMVYQPAALAAIVSAVTGVKGS
jgi:pimeloyl-ACP methyl ester carboxylesterase